jgi:hypothetical protein
MQVSFGCGMQAERGTHMRAPGPAEKFHVKVTLKPEELAWRKEDTVSS